MKLLQNCIRRMVLVLSELNPLILLPERYFSENWPKLVKGIRAGDILTPCVGLSPLGGAAAGESPQVPCVRYAWNKNTIYSRIGKENYYRMIKFGKPWGPLSHMEYCGTSRSYVLHNAVRKTAIIKIMSTFLELEMKVEFSYLIFGPLYVSLISHHIPIVVYKTHD